LHVSSGIPEKKKSDAIEELEAIIAREKERIQQLTMSVSISIHKNIITAMAST
jgi:hypothetical protein